MALELTERAERESQKLRIEPQIVLEVEGVPTLFGAVEILRYIKIGDPGLVIGDDWKIGGLTPVADQMDIISLESGSATQISQQLNPDKGSVSSVSSVAIALIDRNLAMTKLISPGVVIEEILATKAHLWIGFKNTAWPQDYIRIFSGIIDDVESGAGLVKLNIAHPEQLKRQKLFNPVTVILDGAITNVQTTITLASTAGLSQPVNGPDGSPDGAIDYYIRLEDEIIRYSAISGNTLTGCGRGAFDTINVAHDDGVDGKSLVSIEDTAINVALKIMLSGKNGPYVEDLAPTRFLHPDAFTTVPNSIFFEGLDLLEAHGVTVGDYLTTVGMTAPENNVSALVIEDIVKTADGSYLVVTDAGFVEELAPTGTVAIRSRYDSLGQGLAMSADQVDVTEHNFWDEFQLGNTSYRFVIKEVIDGKTFLDEQVYRPVGGYSIPRKGRVSMGFQVGPIARDTLKILSKDNIKGPDKIKIRRTTNKNFYNTIIFEFDKDPLTDKFRSGVISISAESKNRIKIGNKTLVIKAEGLRGNLDGTGISTRTAARYLSRYQLAAEYFESVGVLFRDGFNIEPGDQVILDTDDLKITNTEDGTREKRTKIFEVQNSKKDLKTTDVSLTLVDTNFDLGERYGVISPSSEIVAGTTTSLEIKDSFGALYPGNESKKWKDYSGLPILIHSPDWDFEEEVTLVGVDPGDKHKLLIDTLSVPPEAGWIVEIQNYPAGTDPKESELYKAVHAFLGPSVEVVTGIDDFNFTVDPADTPKFHIGDLTRVHAPDYNYDSAEVEITDVVGDQITVGESLGFTPAAGDRADSMGFDDGIQTYRIY